MTYFGEQDLKCSSKKTVLQFLSLHLRLRRDYEEDYMKVGKVRQGLDHRTVDSSFGRRGLKG